MAEKTSEVATRQPESMTQREHYRNPFEVFANEIDRLFDDFGFGRGWRSRPFSSRARRQGALDLWTPQIEAFQQNHELVVRADLPGMKKEDISVDITDEAITISGERKQEQQSESGGAFVSERSYGSFYRTIPLAHGAMADQAKATFNNGVLEIRVPSPPEQVTRGRRIEVQDASGSKK
ncbi:MAG TPA: Hsp20/alpha crystallin family protein [Vicinamibacterales bacterium]|nr:Hsp20/alpha crystallin family protein [Vicinamibacterales bacterium]